MDPRQGSERATSVHMFASPESAKFDSVHSLFLGMQRAYVLVNGSLSKCVNMSSLHPGILLYSISSVSAVLLDTVSILCLF